MYQMDGLKHTQDLSGILTKHIMVLNERVFLIKKTQKKQLTFLAVSRMM